MPDPDVTHGRDCRNLIYNSLSTLEAGVLADLTGLTYLCGSRRTGWPGLTSARVGIRRALAYNRFSATSDTAFATLTALNTLCVRWHSGASHCSDTQCRFLDANKFPQQLNSTAFAGLAGIKTRNQL